MHKRRTLPVVVSIVLFAAAASAQDKGQTGLTMASPTSLGLLWHASASVALRPEFTLQKTSNETTGASSGVSGTSDSWAWGVGVSGLFYVRQWESLRAYVSPRFAYSRSTTSSQQTISPRNTSVSAESTFNSYLASGSLGAQYSLGRRFAVFAETGFGYTHTTSSGTSTLGSSSGENHNNSWGTRAGIGAILYF